MWRRLSFIVMLLFCSYACVCAMQRQIKRDLEHHLSEPDMFVHATRSSRTMSEFDRAALVLFGMLAISKDLKSLLQTDKAELAWAFALVVSVTLVVDVATVVARACARHGPHWWSWLWHKGRQAVNRLFRFSASFDQHELLLWQQMFEQIMQAALDFGKSHVKLDSNEEESSQRHVEKHWLYYRQYMCDTLMYMATYVAAHDCYYRVKHKDLPSKLNVFGYAGSDADHICFLIARVTKNLHNIADTFMHAQTASDLDVLHVQALYRVTLCMLKKIRLFTQGSLRDDADEESEQYGMYQEFITFK